LIASLNPNRENIGPTVGLIVLGMSKAARKAAEAFAHYPGRKVIREAKALREVASPAGTVHGWHSAKGQRV